MGLTNIKLFILDVDGVLTDGKIWYSDNGEEQKMFHTQDGLGIKRLKQAGIDIAVISGRQSPAVTRRMNELNISDVHQGISNKMDIFQQLLKKYKIAPENVASIGDDLPDLPLLENSGIAIAVHNAVPEIKSIANYCTNRSGGEGAVREACEWLLTLKQHYAKEDAII